MGRRFRVVVASLVGVVACRGFAACDSRRSVHPSVTASPALSRSDEAVHMSIGGLAPGRRVSVRVSSSDARRVAFASQAVFVADSAGTVDVAAVAPVSGSYRTVDAMGLLTSMSGPYGSDFYFWGSDPQTFTVTVSQGNAQSQATFQRRGSDPGVQVHDETIAQTGFYGQYWTPAPSAPPRPAVLVFDGSAGGLTGQLQAA